MSAELPSSSSAREKQPLSGADQAVQGLLYDLSSRRGERLNDSVFSFLVKTLKAYQSGRFRRDYRAEETKGPKPAKKIPLREEEDPFASEKDPRVRLERAIMAYRAMVGPDELDVDFGLSPDAMRERDSAHGSVMNLVNCLVQGQTIRSDIFLLLIKRLQAIYEAHLLREGRPKPFRVRPPYIPRPPLTIESDIDPELLKETIAFLKTPPWNLFKSKQLQEEFCDLKPSEREWIEEMSIILIAELKAIRALQAWPIGSSVGSAATEASHMTLLQPEVGTMNWSQLATELENVLSPAEREVVNRSHPTENSLLFLSKGKLASEGDMLLMATLHSPPNQQGRALTHQYALLIRRGVFLDRMTSRAYTRLLPFVLQVAIAKSNKVATSYVDGSMAGGIGLFGQAEQGMTVLACMNNNRYLINHTGDTSSSEEPVKQSLLDTDELFWQTARDLLPEHHVTLEGKDRINLVKYDPQRDIR